MFERYARGLLFLLKQRTRDVELAQDLRQETFRIAIEKLRDGPVITSYSIHYTKLYDRVSPWSISRPSKNTSIG